MNLQKVIGIFSVLLVSIFLVASAYPQALETRDREDLNPNQELDTFIMATNATTAFLWEIALPDGTYYVTLTCGDARWAEGPTKVRLSGDNGSSWDTIVNDVPTVANEFYPVINHEVNVTAEKLSLELGGNSSYANVLNFIIISDSTETPPTFPIEVNFQPSGSTVPVPGYTDYDVDNSLVYDEARGYGWDATTGLSARDRGWQADQRLDTFIYAFNVSRTWEVDVPIGTYYVTLYGGDPDWATGENLITLEGVTVVDGKNTTADYYYSVITQIVNVFDGKLTVGLDGTGGIQAAALNYIVIEDTRPAVTFPYRVNFQAGFAELVTNYRPDSGATWKTIYGYGWDRSMGDNVRDYDTPGAPQLYDTVVFANNEAEATWNLELDTTTPTQYYVYTSCGNSAWDCPNLQLWVEDQQLLNGEHPAANEYYEIDGQAITMTNDGNEDTIDVTVKIGGLTSYTHLNYLIVDNDPPVSWSFPLNMNFQPAWADTYPSYESDFGAEYDLVAKHGWDSDRGDLVRDYDSGSAPDQRYDTLLMTTTGETATWSIEIPNDDYLVTVVFGNPDWSGGPYDTVNLEGIDLSFGSLAAAEWNTINQQAVTVSDGKLDLEFGSSATPVHLCYMIIEQAP